MVVWFVGFTGCLSVVTGFVLTVLSFVATLMDGLERCALHSLIWCVLLLHWAFVSSVWLEILLLVHALMTGMWDCFMVKAFLDGGLSLELLLSLACWCCNECFFRFWSWNVINLFTN